MTRANSLLFASALMLSALSYAEEQGTKNDMVSKAPEGARLYIISPKDGEKVSQTFTVRFGLSGMGVAPAGVNLENTGHHHLLIDVDTLPDLSKPLPASKNIIHYGGGQTETEITLPPGKHTLQLVLGNYLHIPHQNPVMSKKITVEVE
ncbi:MULTISPECIES: DUF4399 domain-containing protein [unclassified Microbulbifer]|uniref:DUF4399 domain-containing protein n=1 Tax=Microbulbifer spongiae TaxID=2944933 RepID=A0ABY9EG15_9GAMM|nr:MULTISPECIES: DUF4399 domain-containing protein [unclassified Microbulbifer]MDP5210303.1 DUF4399 domain-containing protein [Microbulbifer sp. 2205BS26-8]WKD50986.1 DUF4399 domain-containing protein [Microbulbifer sp. MI-G]